VIRGLLVVLGLFALAALLDDLAEARRDLEEARREARRLRALAGDGTATP
jgi:hypothetical protein